MAHPIHEMLTVGTEVWITDSWNSDDHGWLSPTQWSITAWGWVRTFAKQIPDEDHIPWLRRIINELGHAGGSFRVSPEFLRYQEGLYRERMEP